MSIDGLETLNLMKLVNRLKRRYIAMILADVEREFRYVTTMQQEATTLLRIMDAGDPIDTYKLHILLSRINDQTPSYSIVRKVMLDGVNEFVRTSFKSYWGM